MTRYGFEEDGGAIRASWVTRVGPAAHTVLAASALSLEHGLRIAAALETLSGHVWDCYSDPGATHALDDDQPHTGPDSDSDAPGDSDHDENDDGGGGGSTVGGVGPDELGWRRPSRARVLPPEGDAEADREQLRSWVQAARAAADLEVTGPALSRAYEHQALASLVATVERGFDEAAAGDLAASPGGDPEEDPDEDLYEFAGAATVTKELGQRLGRAVRAAGPAGEEAAVVGGVIGGVLAAVLVEVRAEVAAAAAAERGEFTGRAAQATELGSPDPSPAQVAAADAVLRRDLLAGPEAFTGIDPAAAAVAAAHWLDAAAQVTAEVWGGDPELVVEETDNIAELAVAVPTAVLVRLGCGEPPREVVTDLLEDARTAAGGDIPDPAGLLARFGEALERSDEFNRRGLIADPDRLLPDRVCLLDPRRAAVQLLEELTDAITGCLRLYLEYAGGHEQAPWAPDDEPEDETVEAFYRGVRARARARFRAAVADEAAAAAHAPLD